MLFQTRTHELTIGDAEDRRLRFRVGINIGDVIVEPHDIFGDGVNIAARLEGIAEPGGICISSSAYDQVVGKVAVEFTDLGEQEPQEYRSSGARLCRGPEGVQRSVHALAARRPARTRCGVCPS